MTEAFIYDHVRSPRGRGKQGGALNPITPMNLLTQVLVGLRDRNELDTSIVDDVIMGCVSPVGVTRRSQNFICSGFTPRLRFCSRLSHGR